MNALWDLLCQNLVYWILLVAFMALAIWIYRPGARKRYEADARIPFEEDS